MKLCFVGKLFQGAINCLQTMKELCGCDYDDYDSYEDIDADDDDAEYIDEDEQDEDDE